jgi:transposase
MTTNNNDQKNNNTTENTLESLQNKCLVQEQQIEELTAKINWYEEQFRLSKQKSFGASSEKTAADQITLFNEAEQEANSKAPEPDLQEITYKRRKKVSKNNTMFEELPVEVVEYRLAENEQTCPQCGEHLHEMSKEVRRELQVIPAQVKVVEHVRYVYACRNCEKTDTTTPVITAKMPAPVLPGSFVSPSLMAFVMQQKYGMALPLYRQEQQFKDFGLDLSRQTLANWMIHGANDWLSIIYNRMHEHLIKEEIIHADETRVQVLHEDGRKATSDSYMWLFMTGHTSSQIVLYEYQTTRASKHPCRFLEGFKGYIHADGYPGYGKIPNVTLVGCWAHARRKFHEAITAVPDKTSQTSLASKEGLDFCNRLFELEHEFVQMTDEERYEKRLEQSKPVLDAFLAWLNLKGKQVLPKSALGQAIIYCKNQWNKLEAFLLDGRLELSNNRAERAIKPFVIGRKNWLFSNTPKGATASAIIYSVIETAKANNLNPLHYLTYLFEQLPNIDTTNVDLLDTYLPWSESLPANCRKPQIP